MRPPIASLRRPIPDHDATRRHPQRGDHRPRRPRQDDAGRRDAPPVRPVPRQRSSRASASSTPTTWSASAGSRSWPRTSRSTTARPRSTSSTRPGHADFGGEVERTLADGRRRPRAGRRLRRADAADQVRAPQGVRQQDPADRRDQQDRPARRPARRGAQRGLRHLRRARAPTSSSSTSRTSSPRARAGFASHDPHGDLGRHPAAVRPDRREGARPRGRPRRPAPDALHDARLLRVRRPDRHRPDRRRAGSSAGRRPP